MTDNPEKRERRPRKLIPKFWRITIQVTPQQGEWLNHESERLGISVSELVRRIFDEYRKSEFQEGRLPL